MDSGPGKRRLKWNVRPRLDALGQLWQGARQRSLGARNWLTSKRAASNTPASPQPSSQSSFQAGGHAPPPLWDPADPGWPQSPRSSHAAAGSQRGFWRRIRPASRRQQVGLAVGAGVILVGSLLGISLLCSHLLFTPSNTPIAGGASGHSTSAATASGTVTASASVTATAVTPLTVDFTCARGTIRRTGTVCVHTLPNATLTLSVRFCDGSYAGGKSLHGSVSAGSDGNYTWRFSIRTRCAGTATATVVAKSGEQTVTQSTTFNVTR